MEVIIVSVGVIILLLFLYLLRINRTVEEMKNNQALTLMQQQIGQLTEQLNQRLQDITQQLQITSGQIGTRLDKTAEVVGGVKKELGGVFEATKRIFEVGKDISSLQELLRAPKFRGGFGEQFLENLLAQILPFSHYQLQYRFKNGETVDAIIRIGNGIVPIDSKFPLENFRRLVESKEEEERRANRRSFIRDVKIHIDTIASKYILPDEGTYDFALMYIPAENVYYEAIIKDKEEEGIFPYALKKKVIPASPNSFYAYLQVIVLGLKGMRIEKSAEEIIRRLSRIQGDFTRFKEDFDIVGKHISNAKNKFDETERKLMRLGDKLSSVGELSESPSEPSLTSENHPQNEQRPQ